MVSHSDDIIRRGKQNPTEREIPEHNQDAVSFHLVRFKPGIGPGGRRIFIVCDGPGDEQASPAEKTLAESLTRAVPVGEEGPCERKNALSIIPHPTLIITLLILCGAFPGKQIAHSGDHIPRVVVPTFADKYRNVWVLAGGLERIARSTAFNDDNAKDPGSETGIFFGYIFPRGRLVRSGII